MSEKGCNCNCAQNRAAEFKDLAPVLEQYAKVPGSLITILQKAQDIYGYLSLDATTSRKKPALNLLRSMVLPLSMHSSD